MPELPRPAGGASRLHFITTKTYALIRELLARPPLEPDAQQFETIERPQGRTFRLRIAEVFRQGTAAGVRRHPFEVVPQGDDKVTVRPGKVRWWDFVTVGDFDVLAYPGYGRSKLFAGIEDFEITANGSLWLRIRTSAQNLNTDPIGDNGIWFTESLTVSSADLQIIFNAGDPPETNVGDREIFIEIAKVEIEDGVVTVTEQVLDDNVWLSIQYLRGPEA
jgi:hypothetical protein